MRNFRLKSPFEHFCVRHGELLNVWSVCTRMWYTVIWEITTPHLFVEQYFRWGNFRGLHDPRKLIWYEIFCTRNWQYRVASFFHQRNISTNSCRPASQNPPHFPRLWRPKPRGETRNRAPTDTLARGCPLIQYLRHWKNTSNVTNFLPWRKNSTIR